MAMLTRKRVLDCKYARHYEKNDVTLCNKNTRRYSSLAGKKHCGDVCGCKRSQKVEGHDRLRLQQTRQLMMMMNIIVTRPSIHDAL